MAKFMSVEKQGSWRGSRDGHLHGICLRSRMDTGVQTNGQMKSSDLGRQRVVSAQDHQCVHCRPLSQQGISSSHLPDRTEAGSSRVPRPSYSDRAMHPNAHAASSAKIPGDGVGVAVVVKKLRAHMESF